MMKKLKTSVALSLLGLALTAGAAHATDVQLPITVTVADNLTLTPTALDFGTVAVSAAGSLVLNPDDSIGASSGISQYGGTPAAGNIDISGTPNAVLDVTLPAGSVTLDDGSANVLTVDSFTDDSVGSQVTLDGSGDGELNVGATLTAAGIVPDGTYTAAAGSGNPTISFVYN